MFTLLSARSSFLTPFGIYAPGCFFFVGAALPGDNRPHHKSVFDFDEVP